MARLTVELDTGGEVLYATSYQRYKKAHTAPILQNDRLFSDFATHLTLQRSRNPSSQKYGFPDLTTTPSRSPLPLLKDVQTRSRGHAKIQSSSGDGQ